MQVRDLNLDDRVEVEHYWRVRETALTAGRPRYQSTTIEDFVELMALHDDHFERRAFGAFDGTALVGAALALSPTAPDSDDVWAWPYVPPVYRNDGIGAMLMEALIEHSQQLGRHRLMSTIEFAGDSLADAARHPYVKFAREHGFTVGRRMIRWELTLPLGEGIVESLGAAIATRAKDYRFEVIAGLVQPERQAEFKRLQAAALEGGPGQELSVDPESLSVDAYETTARMWLGQGHRLVTALAFHHPVVVVPEGEEPPPPTDPADDPLVGFSTVRIPPKPEFAVTIQGDTWVDEAHRRRRIGPALKLAVAAWLTEHVPERTRVQTQTTEINRRMASLNRAIGYQPIETLVKVQRRIQDPPPPEGETGPDAGGPAEPTEAAG